LAETVDWGRLSQLPDGVPSGGVFALDKQRIEPRSTLLPRLHSTWEAVTGLPGFLRTGQPARFMRRGLRFTGLLASQAYSLAARIKKIDLVHAHMGPTALWARSVALRHNVPLAVTFHGYDVTSYPKEFGWGAYHLLVDPPAATFIAHSPFVAKRLREHLAVEVLRVPLGVDGRVFVHEKEPRAFSARAAGPRLVFVGNLMRRKGPRIAIETLALLRNAYGADGLAASLDIVGGGPESDTLLALSEVLGIGQHVQMHGAQPHEGVAEILRNGDFLLVPSLVDLDGSEEAFGLVCLEAQACGLLVIGTSCGGLPLAVAPPTGGRIVPQHCPVAMAAAIRELWGHPDRDARRAGARARVLAEHEETLSLEAYERAFHFALSRSKLQTPTYARNDRPFASSSEARSAAPVDEPGSLPAYILGRHVIEVRRRERARTPGLARYAKGWIPIALEHCVPSPSLKCETGQVILDLDGTSPAGVLSLSAWYHDALSPGGFVILFVFGDNRQLRRLRLSLATKFRKVVHLDPLFTPGSMFPKGSSPAAMSARHPGLRSQLYQYLLCLR
jgi:glycosyltransferase involved in cell wall biosynthesis